MTILQDRMFIANTESFLEFFKAPPDQFLVQIPLPLEKLQEFKVSWMKASMVANFFIHQVHPGEQIKDFARFYDAEDPPFSHITQHIEVSRGLGQYMHQFEDIAKVEFQRCHQKAMAALVGQGPRLTAKFNASIGRPIPTTPPPVPTDIFDGYRSPIVEPMGGHGKFMNRPPYARAGATYETPQEAVGATGFSSFQYGMYPPPYFASTGTPATDGMHRDSVSTPPGQPSGLPYYATNSIPATGGYNTAPAPAPPAPDPDDSGSGDDSGYSSDHRGVQVTLIIPIPMRMIRRNTELSCFGPRRRRNQSHHRGDTSHRRSRQSLKTLILTRDRRCHQHIREYECMGSLTIGATCSTETWERMKRNEILLKHGQVFRIRYSGMRRPNLSRSLTASSRIIASRMESGTC